MNNGRPIHSGCISSGPTKLSAAVDQLPSELVITEVKDVLQDFLERLDYRSPHTRPNPQLREAVAADLMSCNAGLSPTYIEGLTKTACTIAESAYARMSYQHQLIVALYTAYLTYVDDLGGRQLALEALEEFGQRFVANEVPADPILGRLAELLRGMYAHYPRLSAHSIVISTLNLLVGMNIELTTKDMYISPGTTGYATYLRNKTGGGEAYVLLNFAKGWRDPRDCHHLQLIQYLDHYTWAVNDVLSFYKEILEGETGTYINVRAMAEQKGLLAVLREVCAEALESIRQVDLLTSADSQLAEICRSYVMGYIEFHFRAERYHLEDLEVDF